MQDNLLAYNGGCAGAVRGIAQLQPGGGTGSIPIPGHAAPAGHLATRGLGLCRGPGPHCRLRPQAHLSPSQQACVGWFTGVSPMGKWFFVLTSVVDPDPN